uniref:LRRCT domain-containing protein n=1 Tax=Syphacia muris TaxID=451379 RepID=A0A0N5B026_9BILA
MGISCVKPASNKKLLYHKPIEWNLAAEFTNALLNNNKNNETLTTNLSEKFPSLKFLILSGLHLTSLEGIPLLPTLESMDLSKNEISYDLKLLSGFPALKNLNLEDNLINELDVLKPLKELKNLQSLRLSGCRITMIDDYRDLVFKELPSLQFLDGYDTDGKPEQQFFGNKLFSGKLAAPGVVHNCGSSCIEGYRIIPVNNLWNDVMKTDGNVNHEDEVDMLNTYLIWTYFNCAHPNSATRIYHCNNTRQQGLDVVTETDIKISA